MCNMIGIRYDSLATFYSFFGDSFRGNYAFENNKLCGGFVVTDGVNVIK